MIIRLSAFLIFATVYGDVELPIRHPDFGLNVKQLIQRNGYPFENHTVITEDGYILEIHRIPYGRNNTTDNGNRPPVLFAPSLFCSSADWVNMGPEKSLGFIIADHGYDVWLANYRGTRWSRKHIRLNPDRDQKEFWNYSIHEFGYYDLPAFIDHILNITKQKALFYVGHSQGTVSLFVLASVKQEYNYKIRLSVALAPVAYLNHTQLPLHLLMTDFGKEFETFIQRNQIYEFLPYNPLLGSLGQIFCNDYSPIQPICAEVFYFVAGRSENQLNKTLIPVIATNTPSGSSAKQLNHYFQVYLSKSFQQYDYGKEINVRKYGQSTPPKYDLNKVTIPHLLYYGSNDIFSAKEDVDMLSSELPNVIVNTRIPGFNHVDVVWGNDVVELVFNEVLEIIKQFKDEM